MSSEESIAATQTGREAAKAAGASCRAGEWVEVRAKEEILATLDKEGGLDGMPFMPEMFAYCGQRLRVHKRASRACDTINPVSSRLIENAVLLDGVRCNGAAHGGCQAACSVFWKDAWLKPAEGPAAPLAVSGAGCSEADVDAATQRGRTEAGKLRYACQTTDFPAYTQLAVSRDAGRVLRDVSCRNVGLGDLAMTSAYFAYDKLFKPETGRLGAAFRWLYDRYQALVGGVPYPRRRGVLEDGAAAPVAELNLQPGEFVRVRPYQEILETLDGKNMNRGLYFDAEMVPYCGGVFRVRSRVEHFLDERTGVMRRMKTPAVILDRVWCRARFSNFRALCPRAIYIWWREAWLERAPEASAEDVSQSLGRRFVLTRSKMQEASE